MLARPRHDWTIALAFMLAFPARAAARDINDIVDSTFRNAVVKIDVSSNTAVFDKHGTNICKSEGTGFFVNNRKTIATAKHVIALDPACAPVIILAQSRKHHWERLAKPLDSEADVALLTTERVSDEDMCALLPTPHDAFDTDALRFGIPAGLTDPVPSELRILDEHGQFEPLVMLNPAPVKGGESGGPVLYRFNVAGIVKARHRNTEYGLMIRGSVIRRLLIKNKIARDYAFACNPSRYFAQTESGSQFKIEYSLTPTSNVRLGVWEKMASDLAAAVEATSKQPAFSNKVFFEKKSAQSFIVSSNVGTSFLNFWKSDNSKKLVQDASSAIDDALIDKWWNEYLASLRTTPKSAPTTCSTDSPC